MYSMVGIEYIGIAIIIEIANRCFPSRCIFALSGIKVLSSMKISFEPSLINNSRGYSSVTKSLPVFECKISSNPSPLKSAIATAASYQNGNVFPSESTPFNGSPLATGIS